MVKLTLQCECKCVRCECECVLSVWVCDCVSVLGTNLHWLHFATGNGNPIHVSKNQNAIYRSTCQTRSSQALVVQFEFRRHTQKIYNIVAIAFASKVNRYMRQLPVGNTGSGIRHLSGTSLLCCTVHSVRLICGGKAIMVLPRQLAWPSSWLDLDLWCPTRTTAQPPRCPVRIGFR